VPQVRPAWTMDEVLDFWIEGCDCAAHRQAELERALHTEPCVYVARLRIWADWVHERDHGRGVDPDWRRLRPDLRFRPDLKLCTCLT
jgi:hypothetical protein